jgi:hypothetical protein
MTKPSVCLIHNVLFTTVSVLMFIFKFIVFIVVYIKSYYSLLLFLLLFYTNLDKSFNSTKFLLKYFLFFYATAGSPGVSPPGLATFDVSP